MIGRRYLRPLGSEKIQVILNASSRQQRRGRGALVLHWYL